MAGRHNSALKRRKRAATTIAASNIAMFDHATVNPKDATDLKAFSFKRDHRLYERTVSARAKAAPEVAAQERLAKPGGVRRANKDEVTSRDRTCERTDAPKTERLAWRPVEPIAASQTVKENGERWKQSGQHHQDRSLTPLARCS